ncbi:MAG TPA: serine/threonine-protein kinase [Kofleriaceae bacterium]|jgi:serine/threonine-protein kinase
MRELNEAATEDEYAQTLRSSENQTGLDVGTAALAELGFDERYEIRHLIAEGGMGQVVVAKDRQIGRDIALKRMLETRRDGARFVREARIQGQLEHPAIVPVYDLGLDPAGEAWFTMKQVRGSTLAEIVKRLRSGELGARNLYSRRRLLTAFSSVCLAIDFAHARGVVHRDLKPDNIMLGGFGEVYVLDWGIAKILGSTDPALEDARAHAAPGSGTSAGQIVGTVGYMAPEQLLGEIDSISPRTDVWALGAILFELLALVPLLPRRSLGEALAHTDEEVDARPSVRAAAEQIPPELDAICMAALARNPDQRLASARDLSDAIERYLDGDRDSQRRRELADKHLERAEVATTRAFANGPDALTARHQAMQEVSRALALDPTREDASDAMLRLLLSPPPEIPPEAREELRQSTLQAVRTVGWVGGLGFLSMLFFLPMFLWMGIRDWTSVGIAIGAILASAGLAFAQIKWPERSRPFMLAMIATSALLIATLTRITGPLMSAPILAIAICISFSLHPFGARLTGVIGFLVASLVVPMALEAVGVLDKSYVFTVEGMRVVPHMLQLRPTPTLVTFSLMGLTTGVALTLYLATLRDSLRNAQEQLHVHTWNLRQLVPANIQRAYQPRASRSSIAPPMR